MPNEFGKEASMHNNVNYQYVGGRGVKNTCAIFFETFEVILMHLLSSEGVQ